jgi:hypothetical protein
MLSALGLVSNTSRLGAADALGSGTPTETLSAAIIIGVQFQKRAFPVRGGTNLIRLEVVDRII